MTNKKFDTLQLLILGSYIVLVFSMLYLPYEQSPEGHLTRGFKSVTNLIVIVLLVKQVAHPFGFENMGNLSNGLFLTWMVQLLGLYLKIFQGKTEGDTFVLSGILFPTVMLLTLSILLYIDRNIYFTGNKRGRVTEDDI